MRIRFELAVDLVPDTFHSIPKLRSTQRVSEVRQDTECSVKSVPQGSILSGKECSFQTEPKFGAVDRRSLPHFLQQLLFLSIR